MNIISTNFTLHSKDIKNEKHTSLSFNKSSITLPSCIKKGYYLSSIEMEINKQNSNNNKFYTLTINTGKNIIKKDSSFLHLYNIIDMSQYINDIISNNSFILSLNEEMDKLNGTESAEGTEGDVNFVFNYKYIEPYIIYSEKYTHINQDSLNSLIYELSKIKKHISDFTISFLDNSASPINILPIFNNDIYKPYKIISGNNFLSLYTEKDVNYLFDNIKYYTFAFSDFSSCDTAMFIVVKGYG